MLRIFISYLSGFKEADFVSCFAFKIVLQFLVADMGFKIRDYCGSRMHSQFAHDWIAIESVFVKNIRIIFTQKAQKLKSSKYFHKTSQLDASIPTSARHYRRTLRFLIALSRHAQNFHILLK